MTMILSSLMDKKFNWTGELDESQWKQWQDFICTGEGHKVFSGDHLEAGSPSDPSFWPIHPNLERLLHAKLMTGGFEDTNWPTSGEHLCNKYICYESTEGVKGEHTQCCYGHNEYDQLLNFASGDVSSGYGPTNAEILQWTDASREDYAMPYVYDDFTWGHCDEDFGALFQEMSASH